jgi:CRISPR-associated protein Cas1
VLTGHGMRLHVDNGALLVRNGFTHYPKAMDERRYFPGDRRRPSRIVVVDGSGSLTFDVMTWLSEQNIPLIRIDWRGNVVTALTESYGLSPKRVKWQLDASASGKAVPIAISLIQQKFKNSIATLKTLPQSGARDRAIRKHDQELDVLTHRPPRTIDALLGIEGRAAFSYFGAWQSLPLRWRGTARHPIPEDWYRVGQRQSLNTRKKGRNRFASHPVNAILNYAYAVLESQVRMWIIAQGYDPTIGYLHTNSERRPEALVFDLMEPLRPIVDRDILKFVQSHTVHPADFTIRSDGVCRINPEMARHAVELVTWNVEQDAGFANALGYLHRSNSGRERQHEYIKKIPGDRLVLALISSFRTLALLLDKRGVLSLDELVLALQQTAAAHRETGDQNNLADAIHAISQHLVESDVR